MNATACREFATGKKSPAHESGLVLAHARRAKGIQVRTIRAASGILRPCGSALLRRIRRHIAGPRPDRKSPAGEGGAKVRDRLAQADKSEPPDLCTAFVTAILQLQDELSHVAASPDSRAPRFMGSCCRRNLHHAQLSCAVGQISC